MGRSFKGENQDKAEVFTSRDETRVARRQARETFIERGEVFQGRTIPRTADGSGVAK